MSVHIKQKFLPAWLLRCDRLGWTGGDWLVRTKGTSGAKGKEKEKSSEGCHFDNFVNSSKGTGLGRIVLFDDAVQMLQGTPSRARRHLENTTRRARNKLKLNRYLFEQHFKPQL